MTSPALIDLKDVDINQDLISLREAIAENAHEMWAACRMSEKEYNRDTAMNTIKLLRKLGPELVKKD